VGICHQRIDVGRQLQRVQLALIAPGHGPGEVAAAAVGALHVIRDQLTREAGGAEDDDVVFALHALYLPAEPHD